MDFGSNGGAVEIDETFIGRDKDRPIRRGYVHKHKVLALVDRESGRARSIVDDDLKAKTLTPILRANIAAEATFYTDEARQYRSLGRVFADHDFVRDSADRWAKPGSVNTNTIEGHFSVFKRGMKGVYQHCSEKHLHHYAAEFEFRYNNRVANGPDDATRAAIALKGVVGRRLVYRDSFVGWRPRLFGRHQQWLRTKAIPPPP